MKAFDPNSVISAQAVACHKVMLPSLVTESSASALSVDAIVADIALSAAVVTDESAFGRRCLAQWLNTYRFDYFNVRDDELADSLKSNHETVVICVEALHARYTRVLEPLLAQTNLAVILCVGEPLHPSLESQVLPVLAGYCVGELSAVSLHSIVRFATLKYEQRLALQAQCQEYATQLEERKVIERAKGLLMQHHNLSEQEAYAQMRSAAMNKGETIAVLARRLCDVFEAHAA